MNDKEAIQMMGRCKQEIEELRAEIGRLKPKAEAYDLISIMLSLLPRPPAVAREDLTWVLSKRIGELKAAEPGVT